MEVVMATTTTNAGGHRAAVILARGLRSLGVAALVAAAACGPQEEAWEPVSWEGRAANRMVTDDDGDDGDDASSDPCVLLAGSCDNADDPEVPTTPADPEPEPEPEPEPDPDGWPEAWAAAEVEMLRLVNEMRTNGGDCPSGHYGPRGALTMQPQLRTAARLHSEDMAEQDYFSHTSQDGRSPWTRIGEAGYPGQPSAENIAAGNAAAGATFQQWVTSDGHCRNMMGNANEIGIGLAQGPARFGSYWTQTFGIR